MITSPILQSLIQMQWNPFYEATPLCHKCGLSRGVDLSKGKKHTFMFRLTLSSDLSYIVKCVFSKEVGLPSGCSFKICSSVVYLVSIFLLKRALFILTHLYHNIDVKMNVLCNIVHQFLSKMVSSVHCNTLSHSSIKKLIYPFFQN